MLRIGMIGFSAGNGHPYSFSAIINGYDREQFAKSGWDNILAYLERQPRDMIGLSGAEVSCAWSQNFQETELLCRACNIETPLQSIEEMGDQVDAVMICRDDYQTHFDMAMPFLKRGLPVYVDKPLCLDLEELEGFKPYLHSGQLMSCSGMAFAPELQSVRESLKEMGKIRLIRAANMKSWPGYSVHMLDAVLALELGVPVEVSVRDFGSFTSYTLPLDSGVLLECDCLGDVGFTFTLQIYGTKGHCEVELKDHFNAFRSTISAFIDQVKNKNLAIPPQRAIASIETLIAGSKRTSELL